MFRKAVWSVCMLNAIKRSDIMDYEGWEDKNMDKVFLYLKQKEKQNRLKNFRRKKSHQVKLPKLALRSSWDNSPESIIGRLPDW